MSSLPSTEDNQRDSNEGEWSVVKSEKSKREEKQRVTNDLMKQHYKYKREESTVIDSIKKRCYRFEAEEKELLNRIVAEKGKKVIVDTFLDLANAYWMPIFERTFGSVPPRGTPWKEYPFYFLFSLNGVLSVRLYMYREWSLAKEDQLYRFEREYTFEEFINCEAREVRPPDWVPIFTKYR